MEPPYKKFAHGLRVQLGKTRDQDAEAIDADAHAALADADAEAAVAQNKAFEAEALLNSTT